MKVAIMQPYFLPYIGYFQLISSADLFVVYDNIKYTKKGWINRNRLLLNGTDRIFTIPVKKASDSLDVRDREVADDFSAEKLLNTIREAYRRAPYFTQTLALLQRILHFGQRNLFAYVHNSILETCRHLGIGTRIVVSSSVEAASELKSQERVLSICEAVKADVYINSIGGVDLYSREAFRARGVELRFLQPQPVEYAQFGEPFVPWLSIVDVMMFNPLATIRSLLCSGYTLV